MPDDVAAIMAKIKAGGHPTVEEAARLREWQQAVIRGDKSGRVPAKLVDPEGIPSRVKVTLDYTEPGGAHYNLAATAKVMVVATLGGSADFATDPAHASVFRLQPQPNSGGSGSISFQSGGPSAKGSVYDTLYGGVLATSGHGDALIGGGELSASVDGTRRYSDGAKFVTAPIHGPEDFRTYFEFNRVHAPFAGEQDLATPSGTASPMPIMKLSLAALVAVIKSGKTGTIKGSETFKLKDGTAGTGTFELTLRPPPLELVVEAGDDGAFQKWIPGPMVKGSKIFPKVDPLEIHVALHDVSKGAAKSPGPTVPDGDATDKIHIVIAKSSQYKGQTMNFPEVGVADDVPDLYFPRPEDLDGRFATTQKALHWISESEVETTAAALQARVVVASRDGGAHGTIEARMDALGITSRDPRTNTPGMVVPLDTNHNDIADAWERQVNANKLLAGKPEDDDESQPAGMATSGDGSSAFDQYRGFVVDDGKGGETYVRPPPVRKSLFVYLDAAHHDEHLAGARMYEKATQITVYVVKSEARLAVVPGDKLARWADFNATDHTALRPNSRRYAVRITDGVCPKKADEDHESHDPGGTCTFGKPADDAHLTPAIVDRVMTSPADIEGFYDNLRDLMDPKHAYKQIAAGARDARVDQKAVFEAAGDATYRAKIVKNMFAYVTMHELGHATGARHHGVGTLLEFAKTHDQAEIDEENKRTTGSGDHACPMRYWHQDENKLEIVSVMAAKWDLKTAQNGAPWKFCDAPDHDWKGMTLVP